MDMSANLEQGNQNAIMSSMEFYAKEGRYRHIESNKYRPNRND